MNQGLRKLMFLGALSMGLVGCASDIYAPPGGGDRLPETAPQPPQVEEEDGERTERLSEQPESRDEDEDRAPSPGYQEQGDDLSPASASLIRKADDLMARGDAEAALGQLERAQRISPRSAQVYFKLSEAYVRTGNLGAAEQFTLKGLSLSGSDTRLQKAGWELLAGIRRERGNVAGAEQAERRAEQL
ncbi:tetratricopeptide repeat protein [Marinobacter sp. OP 3.4]|uniref:tetratricopeptide repeat protein n=1 Tax=Marinobacter sp. OP 3.4 TaxID=3076501 RepID=UPI002E216E36